MTNEARVEHYWYQCQELAFAPGIGDGWPEIIAAPHTNNARLVRKDGPDPEAWVGMYRVAQERADKAEAQLRRCRAETLREAARIAESWWEGNASDDLYKMADEAEQEAEDD